MWNKNMVREKRRKPNNFFKQTKKFILKIPLSDTFLQTVEFGMGKRDHSRSFLGREVHAWCKLSNAPKIKRNTRSGKSNCSKK